MKRSILVLAIGLIALPSCKKEGVKPTATVPSKSEVIIDTRFITEDAVPADTYTVLTFRENDQGADYLWVKHCGEVGVNAFFSSDHQTRVEVYKAGDDSENFVWMGHISVNSADSSLIISKIAGSDSLKVIDCNLNKIQILDLP